MSGPQFTKMPLPRCQKDKDLRSGCKPQNLIGKRNKFCPLRVGIEFKDPR